MSGNARINRRQIIAAGMSAASAPTAVGQLFGKKKEKTEDSNAATSTPPVTGLMPANAFVRYIAIASDLGAQGTVKLLSIYPPEKIEDIKKACESYNEARRQNKGGEPDSETSKLLSQALASASALGAEVAELDAEKKKSLALAHRKLSLMLVADAFATLTLPTVLKALQGDIQSFMTNPMKLRAVGALKSQAQFLAFSSTAIPAQVKSAMAIRDVAKKIAEAQKVKLAENPPNEEVNSLEGLQKQAVISEEVPAETVAASPGGATVVAPSGAPTTPAPGAQTPAAPGTPPAAAPAVPAAKPQ